MVRRHEQACQLTTSGDKSIDTLKANVGVMSHLGDPTLPDKTRLSRPFHKPHRSKGPTELNPAGHLIKIATSRIALTHSMARQVPHLAQAQPPMLQLCVTASPAPQYLMVRLQLRVLSN